MPFSMTANVAEYKGASWDNYIMTVPNTTPQAAQRIAMCNPAISFFFYCRSTIILEGVSQQGGVFNTGDAVFFSGEPWLGSAPQCDVYQKPAVFTTGYVGVNDYSLSIAGNYVLQNDQRQFFDIAILCAANLLQAPIPQTEPGSPNYGPFTQLDSSYTTDQSQPLFYANTQTYPAIVTSGDIAALQNLGITVLLSVQGFGNNPAGWSNFNDATAAQNFANYIANLVQLYGFDGVDIDDEYSGGTSYDSSLAMVTYYMRQAMPGKIISKALYEDGSYFSASWTPPGGGSEVSLAQNLTYGWEMSYWVQNCPGLTSLLQDYVGYGMSKNRLAGGASTSSTSDAAAKTLTQCVKNNSYGGMMIFNVTDSSQIFLSEISNVLYGQNTVIKTS